MIPELWSAPHADRPVDAVLTLPGSKSVTNRALVIAALAEAPSIVRGPLRSRDTLLMAAGLRALGTHIEDLAGDAAGVAAGDDAGDWVIEPGPFKGGAEIHCGLAGTVMRFLPPVATLADGPVRFDGDPRARERPMRPLIEALRDLDVRVDDDGRGALPFTVDSGGEARGGRVRLDASASSQFVSALLLTGAAWPHGIAVHHVGPPVPSLPHIAMTTAMLRAAGAGVDDSEPGVWRVHPSLLHPGDVVIEPDLSTAAPFLAAALVSGGRVVIRDWPAVTHQAGAALRDLLAQMGAAVSHGPEGLTVTGTGAVLGLDADLHDVGELTPVLAALAALADSPSSLRGVAHLRGHETDRLAALSEELNRLGGDVTQTADGLEIRPATLRAGRFGTYDDHRLAHAGAVLGLAVPGVLVENIATTAKTLPDFPGLWAAMLAGRAR